MRFLTVMCRLLYPPNTGGKIRSSKLFEHLHRHHDITVVCFRSEDESDDDVRRMEACASRVLTVPWKETPKFSPRFFGELALNLLSPYDYTANKYFSPSMRDLVRELSATEPFDILLCDFLQPSRNVLDVAFPARVLFQHNVEAVIRQRQLEKEKNPLKKAYLYLEWQKLRRLERIAAHTFDRCIMVSDTDAEIMAEHYGCTNAVSIPTGVDVEFFRAREPEAEGHHLVFTGSMDWLPNEDGMVWFADEILPRIRAELDVTVWVVGRRPSPRVAELGARPGIEITGTVEDVRPFIDRGGVYIVPLRVGSGTRMKIFEAMAMGKAVVSTTIGAEGLPVTHHENIILADEPSDFAAQCVRLLRSRSERERLGRAACEMVRARYTWDVVADAFATICEDVVRGTTNRRRSPSK